MTEARTVKRRVFFNRRRKGQKALCTGKQPNPVPGERVPRVSRLMALAIRFDQLIRDGHVKDQAELAAHGQVTTARLTQIMNLLFLAPDIQEEILFLDPAKGGRNAVNERGLRHLVASADWNEQRKGWSRLLAVV